MRLVSLLFLCLSLSYVMGDDNGGFDRDLTDNKKFGNKRIQLVGKSGQIRVLPANATRGDVFTQLKWLKLEEWDAKGRPVQSINNFASQSATWGTPYQTTVNGIDATAIKLTGTLSVGGNGNGNGNTAKSVPIVVTVFLFNRTVTVDNGNTTVTVDVNSIKFNVDITGWPFQSTNNSLAFGVSLTSGGGRGLNQDRSDDNVQAGPDNGGAGPKPSKAHLIQFGPGSLVSPKIAQVDGVDTPITVLYDGNRNLVWIFPYFANTLTYDPTLGTDGTSTASNATHIMQPSFVVLMIAIVTYFFRA